MRFLRDLLRDQSGLAAVEWALVGPMFLFMLLAIIELGITFTTQATMDGATRDAARLIRTGQAQANGTPETFFQTQLCSDLAMFMSATSCQTNLYVDVVTVSGTTNFSSLPAFTNCNINNPAAPAPAIACPFNPGAAGDLVGVQVTYNRPFIVPWVGQLLGSGNPTSIKLQSTVVFRNEPF